MEEFYRRKYLSPSYSRTPTPESSFQKDKSVADLRRELQECKDVEERFDELCIDIVKLERENKKIESQQAQVEGDYLTHIKKNKLRITELKQDVLDCRESIQMENKKLAAMQAENQQLVLEMEKSKLESQNQWEEKASLKQTIERQKGFIVQLTDKNQEAFVESQWYKKENQLKSSELQKSYEELKKNELKLRDQELECEKKKKEWQQLISQRKEWEKKCEISKAGLESLKADLSYKQRQVQNDSKACQQMKYEHKEWQKGYNSTQEQSRWVVTQNKQNLNKLKTSQESLFQSLKQLQKDKLYLQRVEMRKTELKKGNENIQQTLKHLGEILAQEQEGYSRIMSHMKHSIQQDEMAIQSLSKQAVLLQTMIN